MNIAWTVMQMQQGYNRISIPYESSRYGSRYRLTTTNLERLKDNLRIVVFPDANQPVPVDPDELGRVMKHGIALKITDDLLWLPLNYLNVRWDPDTYQRNNTRVLGGWMDKQRLELDRYCEQCPQFLGRALDKCRPMDSSCQAHPSFPLGGFEETPEVQANWFRAHAMDLDALRATPGYQEYTPKQLMVDDAFKIYIAGMSADPKRLMARQKERSASAVIAARTHRVRKWMCPGCLREGEYCSVRGAASCNGPWYARDLESLARRCEPWMLHALVLGQRTFRAAQVSAWFNSPSLARVVRPSRDIPASDPQGPEMVVVAKLTKRNIKRVNVKYAMACKFLGEEPCNNFASLSGFGEHVRAVAYILYSNTSADSMRASSGWAYTYGDLVEVSISPRGCLDLEYASSGGACFSRRVGEMSDVYALIRASSSAAMDLDRRNGRWREDTRRAIRDERLKVPAQALDILELEHLDRGGPGARRRLERYLAKALKGLKPHQSAYPDWVREATNNWIKEEQ